MSGRIPDFDDVGFENHRADLALVRVGSNRPFVVGFTYFASCLSSLERRVMEIAQGQGGLPDTEFEVMLWWFVEVTSLSTVFFTVKAFGVTRPAASLLLETDLVSEYGWSYL